MSRPRYRIGCSGWSYKHWRGSFYPKGLPQSRWLEHYCTQFDTVELNATFYRLPTEAAVRGWAQRTPPGFTFAVKVSRLITHFRRIRNCDDELATFFERMWPLGNHLGPLLYQLPPTFKRDDEVLARFLASLPKKPLHVFEFRHRSWWEEPVFSLLREHGAAFCVYDRGEETTPVVATCPDLYVRFHGPAQGYAGSYPDDQLARWARDIAAVRGIKRVWAYFNNDVGGHAPRNAARFRELVER